MEYLSILILLLCRNTQLW